MKVKPKTPVKYNDQRYEIGQEFEIAKADYEQHKSILEVIEEDQEPEEDKADGGTTEPDKQVTGKATRKK